jgi:hypothetical protein
VSITFLNIIPCTNLFLFQLIIFPIEKSLHEFLFGKLFWCTNLSVFLFPLLDFYFCFPPTPPPPHHFSNGPPLTACIHPFYKHGLFKSLCQGKKANLMFFIRIIQARLTLWLNVVMTDAFLDSNKRVFNRQRTLLTLIKLYLHDQESRTQNKACLPVAQLHRLAYSWVRTQFQFLSVIYHYRCRRCKTVYSMFENCAARMFKYQIKMFTLFSGTTIFIVLGVLGGH